VFSESSYRLPPAPGTRRPSQFRRFVAQGDPIVSFAQAFLGKVVDMSESNVRTKEASGANRGFTLIELMIAVAIVAIIAMIAIPSYTAQIVKGRRSSAEAVLLDIAQRQQQYLLDVRSYAPNWTTLNTTIPVNVSNYYTIAIAAAAGPPPTFTASATPIAGTAQAGDVTLTIDNTGAKTPAGTW
jgi:type IV pilus assembly protein PilE